MKHRDNDLVGKRVRCIFCGDSFKTVPAVPPGTEGTITFVDDEKTVHVDWDNGRSLGLIPGVDRWQVIS
jgi:hypothetical protein